MSIIGIPLIELFLGMLFMYIPFHYVGMILFHTIRCRFYVRTEEKAGWAITWISEKTLMENVQHNLLMIFLLLAMSFMAYLVFYHLFLK